MKNLYKNIFLVIITLVIISVAFSFFVTPSQGPQNMSLNDLANKINSGEVASITAQGQTLNIDLKNGSKAVAQKETESALTDTLKNLGVEPAALQQVAISVQDQSGLQFWEGLVSTILLPVVIFGILFWFIFRQAKGGANQAFTFGQSRIRLSNTSKDDRVTFEDVAGLKEAKEELVEIVGFLKEPKKFLDLGAKIPRGVLLMGAPGTGKTLLARAVAGEAHVPFFSISASEFVEMFVGVGASRTRDTFATAKKAAPSILFIDEIDAIGRQRGTGGMGGNDEREQTLNQILVELDGFDRDTRVIVLAATNRPDILDQALLRPGRFDRHVMLDLPDINDREAILKIHSKGKTMGKDVDLRKIAVRTPGFAGADLANIMNEAAILAARNNKKKIEQVELYSAIERVILGPERKSRSISQQEKKITAYHEGGHALVSASIKDSDPVHKVSIISRGMAGGYTMKLPTEERHLKTKNQFLAEMAVMLGGFVSEKLTFGDVSTGASNDLKEATEVARRLVTRYGMSDLGPQTFGKPDELMFMGRDFGSEKNYSEDTAQKIDGQVNTFIQNAYETATEILKKNKKALKKIADVLIDKETLEQDEFVALLKPFKIKLVPVRA